MQGLTLRELRATRNPMILYTRSDVAGADFDHFLVFLGVRGAKVLLYDPPNLPEWIEYDSFKRSWSGIGIAVSKDEIAAWRFLWPTWLLRVVFFGGASALLAVLVFAAKRGLRRDASDVESGAGRDGITPGV